MYLLKSQPKNTNIGDFSAMAAKAWMAKVVPNMVFASIAAATAMATVGGKKSLLAGQSRQTKTKLNFWKRRYWCFLRIQWNLWTMLDLSYEKWMWSKLMVMFAGLAVRWVVKEHNKMFAKHSGSKSESFSKDLGHTAWNSKSLNHVFSIQWMSDLWFTEGSCALREWGGLNILSWRHGNLKRCQSWIVVGDLARLACWRNQRQRICTCWLSGFSDVQIGTDWKGCELAAFEELFGTASTADEKDIKKSLGPNTFFF